MKLGKKITGNATFSFDYFKNDGFIGCKCQKCLSIINIPIEIYKSGTLVEHSSDDFKHHILPELIEQKIINLKNNKNSCHTNLSNYILWNMNALYLVILCETCNEKYISIFGMGELQPGREEVQFKGLWQILNR